MHGNKVQEMLRIYTKAGQQTRKIKRKETRGSIGISSPKWRAQEPESIHYATQSSIGLSSKVTPFGSVSAKLLRLLSDSEALDAPAPMGKLDTLPRPGFRVYRPAMDRGMELRLSNSEDARAGVGVGVGESSEPVSGGGGGLDVPDEAVEATESGDSTAAPLVAGSAGSGAGAEACSAVVGDSLLGGTSRLALVRAGVRERSVGLVTLMGKRVAAEAPLERSRRCLGPGAGLVARLRLTIARWRASIAARRLLSSVLIARGRLEEEIPRALD